MGRGIAKTFGTRHNVPIQQFVKPLENIKTSLSRETP
mgnify:CR=1 FL=1